MSEEILDVSLGGTEEQKTDVTYNFATIGEVFKDGVTLIFDGQEEASEKHYKCNTSVAFSAGDRVKILADSGTYVVEYVVGAPKSGGGEEVHGIPSGGAAGTALMKDSNANYDVKWGSPAAANGLPTGGSNGQMLVKSGSGNYSASWANAPQGLPSGGSSGQALVKSGTSSTWAYPYGVSNQAYTSTPIQFRTSGSKLQWRSGSGSWTTLA